MDKQVPCCTETCINEDLLSTLQKSQPDLDSLQRLSELFKVLGDVSRMRILSALTEHELCVCELMQLLSMKQSAVSQQLRVLKAHRLVRYRKEGRSVYYRLDDDHVQTLVAVGMEHIGEER
ncbi:helix-turn-helix transcriptional regulator [Clostridia bacterium]|nr:helix-turn-helix transcriptional regulator [Clostridia bacterium]